MTIRAERDPRFYFRFIVIGVAVFGFALWCVYDGAVKYPAQRERAIVYKELKEAGKLDDWPDVASKHNWPTDVPKTAVDSQVQYVFAGVAMLLSLWSLSVVGLSRGRWIEGSKTGITSSWGQSFDFENVISIDKRQWKKKGIAKVYYQDGNRRRTCVIDDFKFEREPTGKILRALEAHLAPEQITGGPPETESEENDA